MAELDFEIQGRPGEIAAYTFEKAVARAIGLLDEFDSAISGQRRGTLRWVISRLHSNGNLLVGFQSRPKSRLKVDRPADIGPIVARSFLTGFDDLENKCETPAYLSEFGLHQADKLTRLIGNGGPTGFRFNSPDSTVTVTAKTSENIGKLLPIKRTSIGSVEGKLEGVNLHHRPRVIIYHTVTKKAVTCEFNQEKLMEQVKDCLGKNVTVFGILHKNMNGDTLRVTMDRLALTQDIRLASAEHDEGPDPEFATATSTAEYMRRIRGGG
jgi:hypothetical protein